MMGGVVVLAFFAAAWAIAALAGVHAPWMLYCLPIAISLAAVVSARLFFDRSPAGHQGEQKKIGRVVAIWSSVESLGILAAINLVVYLQRPDLEMAAVCAVVGVHFLPLARSFRFKPYYATGFAMIVLAISAISRPQIVTPTIVGFGTAGVLWVTILGLCGAARSATAQRQRAPLPDCRERLPMEP